MTWRHDLKTYMCNTQELQINQISSVVGLVYYILTSLNNKIINVTHDNKKCNGNVIQQIEE